MKKLTLLFALTLILCACSVLKNKHKNKSQSDSTATAVTQSQSIDTSKTITKTVTVTPGITEEKVITLPPYTQQQYSYLLNVINTLNTATYKLKLTVDSAKKAIKLNIYQAPNTTTTTITQQQGITTTKKDNTTVRVKKKSLDLNLHKKTQPNYWWFLVLIPLYIILYLVYKKTP